MGRWDEDGDWSDGNIRIRGKRENIIRFLQEELVPVYELQDEKVEERRLTIENNCGGWTLILKKDPDTCERVYFRGSNRIYIDFTTEGDETEVERSHGKSINDEQVVFIGNLSTTGYFDYRFFSEKARKHKVDIRIFTWEPRIEWSYYITCYRNGTMDEATRKYADWLWESPLLSYR